ncbi:hypothetical protein DAEQUDRAFT_767876 [Daedalea quercina L-15889]|uniref:BTB domain-containing protein n=1 Tax=Daedalea quercina L-15889 TaxID=1314783 RepID=A0A165N8M6_9APHY|nr:hypothetical protein DAEQUDRAFT_767876 [Daedalea quercina L-15889]
MPVEPSNLRKRTCTEFGSEAAAATDPERDEKIWLDDGNTVIIAEKTAFRVHRSVLSLHSEVFRDLFTVPPSASEETLEGCPVVRVSDTADDMRHVLWDLYSGRTTLVGSGRQADFDVVAALLRLAHKYQITNVREDALFKIKALYAFETLAHGKLESHPLLSYKPEDAFQVVQLAHLTGAVSLLPVVLCLSCTCGVFDHPTTVIDCLSVYKIPDDHSYIKCLTQEDVFRCLAARPGLLQATMEVFSDTFGGAIDDDCSNEDSCRHTVYRAMQECLFEVPLDIDCFSS